MLPALTFAAYTITLDGRVVLPHARAAVVGGHVLLPVRQLGETLGAAIGYDGATRSITVQHGSVVSVIPASGAVRIDHGHAYAPLRVVAAAFGMFVAYDAPTRTISLDQGARPLPPGRPKAIPSSVAVVSGNTPYTVTETPRQGSEVHEPYPSISARFAGVAGIDTNSLHVELDGRDVTPYASVIGDQVLFTPRTAVPPGQHTVVVTARDVTGTPVEHVWSFGDSFAFAAAPAPTPFPIRGIWIDRWISPGTNAFDVFVEGEPGITGYIGIDGVPKYFPLRVYSANAYVAHVLVPNGVNQPFARVAARLTLPNGQTQTIVLPQTINLSTPAVYAPLPAYPVPAYTPTPTPLPAATPARRMPRRPVDETPAARATPIATPIATPRPSAAPTPVPSPTPVRSRRPLIRRTLAPSPLPSP